MKINWQTWINRLTYEEETWIAFRVDSFIIFILILTISVGAILKLFGWI